MNYDILYYVLIGGFFTAAIIPLIALWRKSNREERKLDEGKSIKKPEPHQLKEEPNYYALID